jgi:hypothetical protein
MDGATKPVKRIIDAADAVFGIWRDPTQPEGVDFLTIKGERFLRERVATQTTASVKTTAIWCGSLEHAMAAKQVFGDRGLDS